MSRIPNTAEHISENPNTISDGCQDRRDKSLLLFCALNYGREQIKSSQKTKNEKRLGDGTEGNITWWFYGWRPVMDGWGGRRTGSLVSASRFLTRNWAKTSPTCEKLNSYFRSTSQFGPLILPKWSKWNHMRPLKHFPEGPNSFTENYKNLKTLWPPGSGHSSEKKKSWTQIHIRIQQKDWVRISIIWNAVWKKKKPVNNL
jgi:hypothetical protein